MQKEIQKAKRKYIKMFYEAQIISQELCRNKNDLKDQGHVYLYPESTLGMDKLIPQQTLTYLKYDSDNPNEMTFKKKLAASNMTVKAGMGGGGRPDIQDYFSINEEGLLVLASLTEIETNTVTATSVNDVSKGSKTTNGPKSYQATEVTIDYKNLISQYATPISFFIELGMVTRNPEFLAAVVEMVKENTDIQLTVLNTTMTEVTKQVDISTLHSRGRSKPQGGQLAGQTIEYSLDTTTETTTTTTKTTISPNVKVTSVDTWICSQKIAYTKIPGEFKDEEPYTIPQTSEPPQSLPNSDELEDDEPASVSWTTREDTVITTSTKTDTYDSGIASDYKWKAGEKPDENPDYKSFVDLMDVEYKIPNSKEKRTAGAYLTTDAEMFFQLLGQNPETQRMEQIMRKIMHKYDEDAFPDVELDLSIFDVDYSNKYTGGIYGNTVQEKVWYSLKAMGFSDYAIAGVMGNIDYESAGFNVGAIEDGSGEGHGLCQWSFGRKDAIIAYAESKGKTWQDVDIQIQFLIGEMTPGGGADGYATFQFMNADKYSYDTWKNANSVDDATNSFCYSFERPGAPEDSLPERRRRAQMYYQQFHGKELFPDSADIVKVNEYTFPHYLQKNYKGNYGDTNIATGGCAPTSLAMVLSGLTKNPSITPPTVVTNLNEYYGHWTSYYQANGGGTRIRKILADGNFLRKYYNVKATENNNQESIISQLTDGKAAIGSTPGHILAVVPVPDQYKGQGYRFYILDSANGLSGPYRTVDEVRAKRNGSGFKFNWLLEPI